MKKSPIQKSSILITGGAGYIGSHIAKQLAEAGERIIILDDLSTGYTQNILVDDFIIGNCGDSALVSRILQEYNVETVIHLAASIIVPESIQQPLKYYENNVVNTCRLLNCCTQANIKHFIFSSSAAVYGSQEKCLVDENNVCNPINPYGRSKLICEQILQDITLATPLRYVALRYFNVGGADLEEKIGLRNPNATTLIKIAAQTALGIKPTLAIYGTDYPTSDGTAIRDYIHVEDIASAHLQALIYLRNNKPSVVLNCGYGHGYSVLQVLEAVQRLAKTTLNIQTLPRRPGDPAELIADNRKILETLAWKPQLADLDIIIQSSLNWEKNLLKSA